MIQEVNNRNEVGSMAVFKYCFFGPVAYHNYSCAVCRDESAVLHCSTGILHPCWKCQERGYKLVKTKRPWWKFWVAR